MVCRVSHNFQASCLTFRARIYNEDNIDPDFTNMTQQKCSSSGGDNNLSPQDDVTPVAFDNNYFKNLVVLRGLLHLDQQLFSNGSTDAHVRAYSTNAASFANDFASAMVKIEALSPLTGTNGDITTNCRVVN